MNAQSLPAVHANQKDMKLCVLLLLFLNTQTSFALGHGPFWRRRGSPGIKPNIDAIMLVMPPGTDKKLLEMLIQLHKDSGCQSGVTGSLPTRTDEETTSTSVTTALDGSTAGDSTDSPAESSAPPTMNESSSQVDNLSNRTDPVSAVTADSIGTNETEAEPTRTTTGELASDGGNDSSSDNLASSRDVTTVV